jgi:hypothetical protein
MEAQGKAQFTVTSAGGKKAVRTILSERAGDGYRGQEVRNSGKVRLLVHSGIGDVLSATGSAYAAREAGLTPAVGTMDTHTSSFKLSGVTIHDLPTLPLLSQDDPRATTVDYRGFNWRGTGDVHEKRMEKMGVPSISTPRFGMLLPVGQDTRRRMQRFAESLPDRYVVACAGGNWLSEEKALTQEQVDLVKKVAENFDLGVVTVGIKKSGPCAGTDLRGETTIDELCGIVGDAVCVVSAETGVAHMASCYNVPCIVLSPTKCKPAMRDYVPVTYLCAKTAGAVELDRLDRSVRNMLAAAHTQFVVVGIDRTNCGVAETARDMAKACGVPWVSYKDRDPDIWAVAEWIDNYGRVLKTFPQTARTVVSSHQEGLPNPKSYPGIIWHCASFYRQHRGETRRAWYVPLPTLDGRDVTEIPDRPRKIMWHGHIHKRKGLRGIIEAFGRVHSQIPETELHIIAGMSQWDPPEGAWLKTVDEPGVTVEQNDYWTPEELHERSLAADLFVSNDIDSGEHSASAARMLAYRRPIIVSRSTRQDEIRGWCETNDGDLADTMLDVFTDREKYARLCARAMMGASYRSAEIVARQYRAAVTQCAFDELQSKDRAK